MKRIKIKERPGWRDRAREFGFKFHTMHGEPYWSEEAYYQFTLQQIEEDLEDPTEEIHSMCLQVVDRVVHSEELLSRFRIPEQYWDFVLQSWQRQDPSLYSRLDLAYTGKGPAKLLENNADTPTSLYETGFWQWLWLEEQIKIEGLPPEIDQFNMLQEKLIERFIALKKDARNEVLHFSCCKDTEEDRGTVQYLEDCAIEAGIETEFVYIEDIGLGEGEIFTDLKDQVINWMFKLYPWEFMLDEEFGQYLLNADVDWLEPPWKSIVSNKALLPLLWEMFPGHKNLLPAFFDGDQRANELKNYVKKPIFAREGANVSVIREGKPNHMSEGPYGEEGFIIQEYSPLPEIDGNHVLVGSWLVDDEPAGISIREDRDLITQDLSRYLPHVILGD